MKIVKIRLEQRISRFTYIDVDADMELYQDNHSPLLRARADGYAGKYDAVLSDEDGYITYWTTAESTDEERLAAARDRWSGRELASGRGRLFDAITKAAAGAIHSRINALNRAVGAEPAVLAILANEAKNLEKSTP